MRRRKPPVLCSVDLRSILHRAWHRLCSNGSGCFGHWRQHPFQEEKGLESRGRSRHIARLVFMKYMTSPGLLTLRSCLPTCDIHPRHRALSQGSLPCLRARQAWSVYVLPSRLVTSNTFIKGIGYVLNAISWVSGFVVGAGVIITGIAADRGQKWAAGNRSYTPIHDHRRHRSYTSIQGYGTNA